MALPATGERMCDVPDHSSSRPVVAVPPRTRLDVVDALRAIALLGILSVNIWFFADPVLLTGGVYSPNEAHGADQLVHLVVTTVFQSKSYVVFSFLFGLSFVLAWAAAHRSGASEVSRTVRRCVALIVLGVLHGFFLFAGDILLAYGILGFALLGMRRVRTRWLLILGIGVMLLWAGLVVLLGLVTMALEDADLAAYLPVTSEEALSAYTSSALGYLGFQASVYPGLAFTVLVGQGPMAFGAFLIGLAVGRAQLLERILKTEFAGDTAKDDGADRVGAAPRVGNARLLLIGLPALLAGGVVSAQAAVMLWGPWGDPASGAVASFDVGRQSVATGLTLLAGPVQALGYVAVLLAFLRSRAGRPVVAVLQSAGRMSLTNYLGQSAVLAVVFSGLGFGLAGQFSAVQIAVLISALWAAQLALSWLWFRRFRRGPVEAPVRAFSYATTTKNHSQG